VLFLFSQVARFCFSRAVNCFAQNVFSAFVTVNTHKREFGEHSIFLFYLVAGQDLAVSLKKRTVGRAGFSDGSVILRRNVTAIRY
jgi:hypothetical protein